MDHNKQVPKICAAKGKNIENNKKAPRKNKLLATLSLFIIIGAIIFTSISSVFSDLEKQPFFEGNEDINLLQRLTDKIFSGTLFYHNYNFSEKNDINIGEKPSTNTGNIQDTPTPSIKDTPLASEIYAAQIALLKKNLYTYDYTKIPEGKFGIIPMNLSGSPKNGEVLYTNTTSYKISEEEALLTDIKKVAVTDKPLVLIVHTHATESYAADGQLYYDQNKDTARSENIEENVVSVGKVIADALNEKGIPTIHCEIMHDAISYKDSYQRSAETIAAYIAKYPSIQYVFDVHRDSIITQNNGKVRPVVLADGKAAAQMMLVVGTDEGGAYHPYWRENLAFATALQKSINEEYGEIMRPINVRTGCFNQNYTTATMLLEVGSCGNSLQEAKYSAEIFAEKLGEFIFGNQ